MYTIFCILNFKGTDYDSDPIAICKTKKKRKEVVTVKCDGEPKTKKKKGKEVIAMTCGGSEPKSKKKNEGVYQLTV